MYNRIIVVVGFTLAAAWSVSAPAAEQTEVDQAVRRAANYLKSQQKERGNWAGQDFSAWADGVTNLCALALMKSGLPASDDAVGKAIEYLRTRPQPDHTYTVALQTVVFATAGGQATRPAPATGPAASPTATAHTANRPSADLNLIQRNVRWLEAAQLRSGPGKGSWSYGAEPTRGDNSNARFAVLALDEAGHAGAQVKPETWRLALAHYLETQNEDGSWGYMPGLPGTGSMTSSGLGSLAICAAHLQDQQSAAAVKRATDRGWQWLRANNPRLGSRVDQPTIFRLYYLHALQQAGKLCGQEQEGSQKWCREGADLLVAIQEKQGTWQGFGTTETGPLVATSLAVLFLTSEKR